MEEFVVYLFYLALLLLLGIIITGVTSKLKLSNILFLVIAGIILKRFNIVFFDEDLILILSALTLIMIVLETTMKIDLKHIKTNFLNVLRFNLIYFIISSYIMTLAIFMFFEIPGRGFEQFALCFVLSIILYGVESSISTEFSKEKKNKVHEIIEIEGLLSGPFVVIFSFFIIHFISSSMHEVAMHWFAPVWQIFQQSFIAVIIGIVIALMLYGLKKHFNISKELWALSVITSGIISFAVSEFMHSSGSLSVAVFGLLLRGLTKKNMPKEYTATLAHILYIIVFILFGSEIILPSLNVWLKGIGVFIIYIMIRFLCIVLFMKNLYWKEKFFMTLNVAKGIEVALVLFLINKSFKDIVGVQEIISIGFMFFILSYIVATFVNFFSEYFEVKENKKTQAINKKNN